MMIMVMRHIVVMIIILVIMAMLLIIMIIITITTILKTYLSTNIYKIHAVDPDHTHTRVVPYQTIPLIA